VKNLESEEVRGIDGHNKKHQGRLAFGKTAHGWQSFCLSARTREEVRSCKHERT